MDAHKYNKQYLIDLLDACVGRTLGDVDRNNVFRKAVYNSKVTGIAGDVIEQSVLGYPQDNAQRPDLIVDGVDTELKTTGLRNKGGQLEAKEPMSITAVSPHRIVHEKFYDSMFWHKLAHMLLVYYLYDSDVTVPAIGYKKFPILGYDFHEFSEADKAILENDWQIVRDFIRQLQADYEDYQSQYPRISSELRPLLMYIDTAPKWPNPPRFRLKRSVVTSMARERFGETLEDIPEAITSYRDLDRRCHELAAQYGGQTLGQIATRFGIESQRANKALAERIIVKMFGADCKKLNDIEVFSRAGVVGKSITITRTGARTEDMKLFPFDFDEIRGETSYEDSSFRAYFSEQQILCIIFEEPSANAPLSENRFIGFKRLSFSDAFIDGVCRAVWNTVDNLVNHDQLRDIVSLDRYGNPVVNKNGVVRSAPNFPKSSDGAVFMRGSGIDSSKKPQTVNGIKMLTQYIWIRGSFIVYELNNLPYL